MVATRSAAQHSHPEEFRAVALAVVLFACQRTRWHSRASSAEPPGLHAIKHQWIPGIQWTPASLDSRVSTVIVRRAGALALGGVECQKPEQHSNLRLPEAASP